MTIRRPCSFGCVLLCLGALAQLDGATLPAADLNAQGHAEQKHFLECLATVYRPDFWFSYNDSLFFQPRTEEQARQLEVMKVARARYGVLTNREVRHALAARIIAGSGVDEHWQRKLLLPFSPTNSDLTPTLGRSLRVLPRYAVVQSLPPHDALLKDGDATYFVMDFGRAASDGSGTNACLIREGTKSYTDASGRKTVEAFTDVALNRDEEGVLNRVAAAFQRQAASLSQAAEAPRDRDEFEACKARANDANPFMEYRLARCYLEGRGTETNAELGLDWMRRAARSGSGDAAAYLEKSGRKAP